MNSREPNDLVSIRLIGDDIITHFETSKLRNPFRLSPMSLGIVKTFVPITVGVLVLPVPTIALVDPPSHQLGSIERCFLSQLKEKRLNRTRSPSNQARTPAARPRLRAWRVG